MRLLKKLYLIFGATIGMTVSGGVTPAHAEHYFVKNHAEYFAAEKKLQPGDVIILANGRWHDFEIKISGKGTKDKPITLISETAGKVVITGRSNLRIGGQYIIVTGLVFAKGYSPSGEVISFRRSKDDVATHSRVTEVVIDHFSKPDRTESDYWVGMYGRNNRFDHNYLVGKTNQGVTLAVRLDTPESRQNYHRIDHNYFGARPVLGSNGGETLRVGTSAFAQYDSHTTIDNNYFEECDGEVEIISIKSGRNIVRENVFRESSGAVTLRHGDYNLVERNVFLGRGKDHTGGIRVINKGQTVRQNYMEGLRGTGFASALTVMNGVPNSPVNRYVQVSEAVIENNSVINSSRITLAAGSSEERSATPISSSFTNNLLSAPSDDPMIKTEDDISGIAFSGNIMAKGHNALDISGISSREIELVRAENGLLYPVDPALAALGAPRDLKPVARDATGPSWYPKPSAHGRFGTGQTITVSPGEDSLTDAFEHAKAGDILALAPGQYLVNKTMILDHAVTVAAAPETVTINFTTPALFEINEGGNLRLEGVTITGREAPDNVGNAVVRTTNFPMQANFQIELDQVDIRDLTVNNSFHVIALGKGAFAQSVKITNSHFANITGSVVQAVSETDDYGRYNAEYIVVENSEFENIGEEIVALYRGGTDESTFGPHIWMTKSTVTNSGKSKKNKTGASLYLHGVQDARIIDNSFTGSAPLKIEHTAGKPVTCLRQNRHIGMPDMELTELMFEGPFRITEICEFPVEEPAE